MPTTATAKVHQPVEQRAQVIEEPTIRMGGPIHKQVTPKTYQVLKDELPASAIGGKKTRFFSHNYQQKILKC